MGSQVIQAPNIHTGGGKVLLSYLLDGLDLETDYLLVLDARLDLAIPEQPNIRVKYVTPSLIGRLWAEVWLSREAQSGDKVLCFGSLPPLFRLKAEVTVFIQNRYLLEMVELSAFPIKTRLRLMVERLWLRWRKHHVDRFVVQTPSMQRLVLENLSEPAHIVPFIDLQGPYPRSMPTVHAAKGAAFDFIYVASGDPHKNHRTLIEAWCLLAKDGLFPSLALTLDARRYTDLCRWVDEKSKKHNIRVTNLGSQSHDDVMMLYAKVGALIYPSMIESFGIPLIEARMSGMAVLAAELDYVRDVIDPEESFDPVSPVSIVRAVKRHLGKKEEALPLINGSSFLRMVLERE